MIIEVSGLLQETEIFETRRDARRHQSPDRFAGPECAHVQGAKLLERCQGRNLVLRETEITLLAKGTRQANRYEAQPNGRRRRSLN